MKSNAIKSTVLGILSIQSLFASTAQAKQFATNLPTQSVDTHKMEANNKAERIIQKRLVGFDPKQAIETLTYLQDSGIQKFESDGSLIVTPDMIQDLMETAAIDGLEVRILNFKNQLAKVKFAAYDLNNFNRSQISKAKDLAKAFNLKCDMDEKEIW